MKISCYRSILVFLLGGLIFFNSCLSARRPPAPLIGKNSTLSKKHTPYRSKRSKNIISDASDTPKNIPVSGNLTVDYAHVLGISPRQIENQHLYVLIDDWMGTPHAYGGSTKRGIDCSAFVHNVMSEVYGVNLPRTSAEQADFIKKKRISSLKEGDLVFFNFGSSRINHVGIYLHNNKFVHTSTSKGVIISNLDDSWYKKAFNRAGSWR